MCSSIQFNLLSLPLQLDLLFTFIALNWIQFNSIHLIVCPLYCVYSVFSRSLSLLLLDAN